MDERHAARPILMIAEKFAPHAVSGTARPLYFARHLPAFGYRPSVLAVPVLGDEPSDPDLLRQLPDGIEVSRPLPLLASSREWARDFPLSRWPWTATPPAPSAMPVPSLSAAGAPPIRPAGWSERLRLSERRQMLGWLAHWYLDWLPPAFLRGLQLGRQRGVQLVWVTAPPARTLVLGYLLSRALRRPLVVDLRDPWTYGSLWRPSSPIVATLERAWAERILDAAAGVVFTSPFTQREMEARFARLRGKSLTITNGFSADDAAIAPRRGAPAEKCLLRYCGVLHVRRRPDVLLGGLALAIERTPAMRSSIHLDLVGDLGGNDAALARPGLGGCVSASGRVSRAESLALMRGADVNVLLQTISTGTDVIASKAFDYLAARRPILGVVDLDGGDAWLLRQTTGTLVVSYQCEQDIAAAITTLHARWQRGDLAPLTHDIAAYERRHLTERLANLFDRVLSAVPSAPPACNATASSSGAF